MNNKSKTTLMCELHPKANKPKPPSVGEKNPKTQKKINTSKSSNTSDTKQTFKTFFPSSARQTQTLARQ
jgi:hypothetical protein